MKQTIKRESKDYYKAYENMDDMLDNIKYLRKHAGLELPFNLFQDRWNIRGEIELSNADPIVGFKKKGKFYIDRELISCAI